MTWRPCSHPTLDDHSSESDAARIWRCSNCSWTSTWSEAWGYFGSLECKNCWMADISWVACSDECRDALQKSGKITYVRA